jgi:hypothetical protein
MAVLDPEPEVDIGRTLTIREIGDANVPQLRCIIDRER